MRAGAGAAAREGTAAHLLLEHCLREGTHPRHYVGVDIMLLGADERAVFAEALPGPVAAGSVVATIPITEQMAEGVTLAVDYVNRRIADLPDGSYTLTLEQKTNPLPDRDDTRGTADVTIDVAPDFLEVVDYKNGRLVVEHKSNPQLLAYLAGRAEDTGWRHDRYAITVIQPNAFHEEGRVRSFEVTEAELRAFQSAHRAACERADQAQAAWPDEPDDFAQWASVWLSAGDHCTFCEAGPVCPARRDRVAEITRARFADAPHDLEVPVDTSAFYRRDQVAAVPARFPE